jgi:hypothetical protein
MGYKFTSEPFFIGASITESGANTFTAERIETNLDAQSREGLVIHAVYWDGYEPDFQANTQTQVNLQLVSSEPSGLLTMADGNLISRNQKVAFCGAVEWSGFDTDSPNYTGPYDKKHLLGVVATDVWLSVVGYGNSNPKGGNVRMVVSRVKLDADTYAAILTNQLNA